MSHGWWRIATDTPDYEAHDLTGKGAESTGGRWNPKGLPIIYTSENRSLACLETVVHLKSGGLPLNRYLVSIEAPDSVWVAAEHHTETTLPIGWDAEPPGAVSIALGARWLQAMTSALLIVPSMIVPEERNILINPRHSDSRHITARKVRKWTYDPRLSETKAT